MDTKGKTRPLTALEINLERTKAVVDIPEKYRRLLGVVKNHYGVSKRTEELLVELHHPFVNWEYLLVQLKTLSIGDFYDFNTHEDGLSALKTFADIYLAVITSAGDEEVRDNAVRYCFEYLNTVLSNSGNRLARNAALFPPLFRSLADLSRSQGQLLKKSSGYVKAVARRMMDNHGDTMRHPVPILDEVSRLLFSAFQSTYRYWLTQPDPSLWFSTDGETREDCDAYRELIVPLSHEHLRKLIARLEDLHQQAATDADGPARYLEMPDHAQIANGYLVIADALEKSGAFEGRRYLVKLHFLFKMMGVAGLSDIHNTGLIEINRCLGRALKEESDRNVNDLVREIFRLWKKTVLQSQYRSSILDCITTLAKEIFELNNHSLVDTFIEELVAFGFQHPDVKGSTAEWQIQVNPAHIQNIRSWLEIISRKPRWTKRLLSALIINLKLKGVFIRDTDLLQKDISRLLNADILPAYNLVKQLLRIFPIYFTEIGAEGELRTISTAVDELSARRDRLIYFLRKQSHVESNSRLVPFIEDIFRYWNSGDKRSLQDHLPAEVYGEVEAAGEYFDELHIIFGSLFQKIHDDVPKLLEWDREKISKEINCVAGVSGREKERAELMIRFYQLIYNKYFHQHMDILRDLETSCLLDMRKIRSLKRSLARKDYYKSLTLVLAMLAVLKEKVLSSQKMDYFENIYYKRHIAAGIPSMYGSYREEKFEAMGLTFRLESFATMLFERLVESLNLKFITKSTLLRIHEYLWLYIKALELEGLATEGLVAKLRYITSALQIRQFSIDQYIDIFQFIAKGIQDITRDYYIDAHRSNLPVIIGQMIDGDEWGHDAPSCPHNKIIAPKDQKAFYQYSENFVRSIIASAFGLQVLDNFVNAVIRTLSAELEKFKDNKEILNLVMAYIPELAISTLYKKNRDADNQILIGNKAYLLKELISFNLSVPPGFIITTEVFRGYEGIVGYKHIYKDLKRRVYKEIKELERITGKTFGDPRNPLLLSVRSGATISLPGMMCSILNVGINETIAEGLAQKEDYPWAAWDSYRRFLQTWAMFQGIDRNIFDEIMKSYKSRYAVAKKFQFNPEQMKQLALSYKEAIVKRGIRILDNPYQQLQHAILDVFASWHSEQARIYRHQIHLSDEWGTAVIVQAMVFGNLNEHSGSGVIFTRDPKGSSQDVAINGDFIFCVQGEDIVSGLVETFPISEKQRITEKRESLISLETKFPEIYSELVRIAELLVYEKGFNQQEIEFTFENDTKRGLYILQTRDMVQRETDKVRTFVADGELERSFLGIGIGVSGGALTGRAVYSEKEIEHFREKEPETALILIRPDTVPDDVGIILKADGILTARGGGTSHAAVTIPQLNKVGVVGFNKLHVYESQGYSKVDGRTIRGGDFISIDGWSGAVYAGKHEIGVDESYKIVL
ncbi:MAG: pyruvate, phosphate dikinase [Syntrophobacterales bacterium CG_4_8_14_3_um_filter_58_8]|nr:MAG: pyruvate, phosphate dikinase [Syntrophobacterales bacterium CG_4_8_14_3_um_filter_58_8]